MAHGNTMSSPNDLQSLHLLQFLRLDCRPSFVVDTRELGDDVPLRIAFANEAFQRRDLLPELLPGSTVSGGEIGAFHRWLRELQIEGVGDDRPTFTRGEFLWNRVTIGTWRVICGNANGIDWSLKDVMDTDAASQRYVQLSKAVAEMVTVGICFTNSTDGRITAANDKFYELTNAERAAGSMSWLKHIHPDDVPMVIGKWTELASTGGTTCFEARWDRSINSPDAGEDISDHDVRWLLINTTTDRAPGALDRTIITCTTDITEQKVIAQRASQRADEVERLSAKLVRFQRMVEYATVGMFGLTAEGGLTEANDAFHTITGIPKGQPSLNWFSSVIPEDLRLAEESLHAASRGQTTIVEIRSNRSRTNVAASKNPELGHSWLLYTFLPIHGCTNKEVFEITGCVTDITHQKAQAQSADERAELLSKLLKLSQEAKASEARFSHFADNVSTAAIVITNLDGNVVYTNDAWHTITGLPRGPMYGPEVWKSVVMPEDLEGVESGWTSAMNKVPTNFEVRYKGGWMPPHSEGRRNVAVQKWIHCSAFPEVDEDGKVISIMSCLQEISQFKWVELLQREIAAEATEAKRQASNFMDMTSHECRNPLSVILQCADYICTNLVAFTETWPSQHKVLESTIDAAKTIVTCAEHQKTILSDVLTLSKLDSNLLQISPVPCETEKMIRDTMKLYQAEFDSAKIDLTLAMEPSLNALNCKWLSIDNSRLLQILINLLTNALKFTPGGGKVTIKVSASVERPGSRSSDGKDSMSYVRRKPQQEIKDAGRVSQPLGEKLYLHFAVSDTGCGLTDEEMGSLFKRFSQASPRTHMKYGGGSGLGLFICRQLVDLQDGAVGVTSSPGKGSTFAFYVGVHRCDAPFEKLSQPTSQPLQPVSKPANLNILVVEDNLVNQKVLAKQLRNIGCQVYTANDGQQCLDFIKRTRFWRESEVKNGDTSPLDLSVILLDIEMPVMNGLDCIRRIRELQNDGHILYHIPVIAVSANARTEQMADARAAGMDDVVTKPFKVSELVPTMTRIAR